MLLNPNDTILFYGDSITDAGRRNKEDNNGGLGRGYPGVLAAILGNEWADLNLKILNRGISGNRVYDLEDRLEKDCLALKPDVVSILIGINDTWRRYDRDIVSPVDEFKACYERICKRIRDEIDATIVILEPFVLPVPEDRHQWREDLDPRIYVIRQVAWEHADAYIPLDGLFAAAAMETSCQYWLPDGVHPSPAGHGLIAEAWIETVCG